MVYARFHARIRLQLPGRLLAELFILNLFGSVPKHICFLRTVKRVVTKADVRPWALAPVVFGRIAAGRECVVTNLRQPFPAACFQWVWENLHNMVVDREVFPPNNLLLSTSSFL